MDDFITDNFTQVQMYQFGAGEFVVERQAVTGAFQGA